MVILFLQLLSGSSAMVVSVFGAVHVTGIRYGAESALNDPREMT
jgi:hypothetical protein